MAHHRVIDLSRVVPIVRRSDATELVEVRRRHLKRGVDGVRGPEEKQRRDLLLLRHLARAADAAAVVVLRQRRLCVRCRSGIRVLVQHPHHLRLK